MTGVLRRTVVSDLTLKMASAQVVEMSVTNNSPSQDSSHPDDLFQSRYSGVQSAEIIPLKACWDG